jgi:hypothetical protein
VHAVAAADHRRQFVPARLVRDYASNRLEIIEKDLARFIQLHRERRVQNIR